MSRITIVCGAYGSGKTEFAVNYALDLKQKTPGKIGLIDLDIVNPYFRSRDLTNELAKEGLTIVSSGTGFEEADIPALSPRIFSLLQDTSYQVVFDVGGDPAGARALGRFNQYFQKEPYDLWIVVNSFRPDTRSSVEATQLIKAIQNTSRLQATGIVSNINFGPDTTLELWKNGLRLINEISEQLKLPIVYHAVEEKFLEKNLSFFQNYQIFPVELRMLPPWLNE